MCTIRNTTIGLERRPNLKTLVQADMINTLLKIKGGGWPLMILLALSWKGHNSFGAGCVCAIQPSLWSLKEDITIAMPLEICFLYLSNNCRQTHFRVVVILHCKRLGAFLDF